MKISPDTHTLYLCGPMTGYPLWNFPAFDTATKILRAQGFAVVSPAEMDRELGFDEHDERREAWTPTLAEEASRRDLRAISHVDAVAVLPGFATSKGARAELTAARWIGLPIISVATGRDITDDVDRWLAGDPLYLSGVAPEKKVSERRSLLEEAADLVDGDRNAQYGDPRQDFRRTAILWSTYLDGKTELDPEDVAALMALLKLSRIRWSPEKRDSWVDLAGYAACGWHCVAPEAE